MKNNMINYLIFKMKSKYIFHKNYQAHKLFKDILYIPGYWVCEYINLTDDLQLRSNHNRSSTRVII